MRIPLIICFISLCSVIAALLDPARPDWLLLGLPCLAAGLVLLARAWRTRLRVSGNWAIVDGSNVMHWKEGAPDIGTLREVLAALVDAGLKPSVVFDANAGYKIAGRHMNDRALARVLGLPVNHIMVAPKGTPADPLILRAARDFSAQIVTNDRFCDWADDYSDVLDSTPTVRGGYKQGKLWLSL